MLSKSFTITLLVYMRLAVKVRHTVTVASSASGTLATMMPMIHSRLEIQFKLKPNPIRKKVTPRRIATGDRLWVVVITLNDFIKSPLFFS